MAEVAKRIFPYKVHMMCDVCKEGEMISLNTYWLATNPPQNIHKCNKCGREVVYKQCYPYIEYREN